MSVRGPVESSARREDGVWLLALASVVTPSSSFTTVSYCTRVMRCTCDVPGIPGMQGPTTTGAPPVPGTTTPPPPPPLPGLVFPPGPGPVLPPLPGPGPPSGPGPDFPPAPVPGPGPTFPVTAPVQPARLAA